MKKKKRPSLLHVHDKPMTNKNQEKEKQKCITKLNDNSKTHRAKLQSLGFINSCIQAIHPPYSITVNGKGKNTTVGVLHNNPV